MDLIDLFNYAGVLFVALFSFLAGRVAERRYWVNRTWKESDYRD